MPEATQTNATNSAPTTPAAPPPEGAPNTEAATTDPAAPPADAGPSRDERINAAITKSRAAAAKRREEAQRLEAAERRAAQLEQSHAQTRRELEEERSFRARAQKDPLSTVRELGVDARVLAERALKEGTPEAAHEALKAEVAELRAERQKERDAEERQRLQSNLRTAERELVEASRDVAKYPSLAGQPPRAVLALAKDVLSEALEKTGSVYSDAEVLTFLEEHWSSYQKKRAAEVTQPLPTQPGADPQQKSAAPRTLSNAAPPKTSPEIEEIDLSLPEHEQRKKLVEIFERKQRESSRR